MNKAIKSKTKYPYLRKEKKEALARTAYFTYASSVLKNSAPGNQMPVWEDLSDNQRQAWKKVVIFLHNQ